MNESFRAYAESLHPLYESLVSTTPVKACELPPVVRGSVIYLFSEGNAHLYVGRTDRLRERLGEHCRKSSSHNSAPFAFAIAREKCNRAEGSRAALEKHEVFGPAFVAAKERIRKMDVRYVKESDPLRQALLEIYVSVALKTKYNSFKNH